MYGYENSSNYDYILDFKNSEDKGYNAALFNSIDQISDAIKRRSKVQFQYLTFNTKKTLVPKYKDNNGFIKVSPYHFIWALNHYYLFCSLDHSGERRFLRVDKIGEVKTLEDERSISLPAEFNIRDYTRNQAFMFGGQQERIQIRCEMRMLDQVIDFFGEDAAITPINDQYFEATFMTSVESIKYWVLQYITAIDEIRPPR